jgi:FtsP/CotA-like multicopper oxidase with cupredoxin domain
MKSIWLFWLFLTTSWHMMMPAMDAQSSSASAPDIIRYDLWVSDTTVNYTGHPRNAIAVNGSIPMPTLHFTEGDSAVIYVHNQLNVETSIHWHGLLLPNQYDGVPYLTTQPIQPGQTHLYTFRLKQHGTYWYHSHSRLQEQSGMYGALIIEKKKDDPTTRAIDQLPEYTLLLSDWTDEKPFEVHRKLHHATDWYAIRKGSTQSYWEAIKEGYTGTKINNEWKRMLAMDVSDVYYDQFTANGKPEDEATEFKPGQKIRLRIINGSSSTYFWLQYAGGKITVVANDGPDIEPVDVDRMLIAVAETYDVVLSIPAAGTSFEFLATSEDRTKSTSLWLGDGIRQLADPMPKLKYFEGMKMMNGMMKMNGDLDDMGMKMSLQQMDMNVVMYPEITKSEKRKVKNDIHGEDQYTSNALSEIVTLNYAMLRSPVKTKLPDAPVKEFHFNLTGNMNRYVWTLNNKTVSETDKILIHKGENVKIILYNGSMMRHPMHLHGHFFRLLNGQGDYAPLKNVVDIMPMETDTLEFAATESNDWFFHCHILYHMMSGMGRIFSYEDSPPNPELPDSEKTIKKLYRDDREFHFMAKNDFATNGNDGEATVANTRWNFQGEWRLGYTSHHGQEMETHLGRYIGRMQWLFPYAGYDWRQRESHHQEDNIFGNPNSKDNRSALCFGIQYTLPMLIKTDARIDSDGYFRFQLMREDIPLTDRLRFDFMVNTDLEYMTMWRYILTKNLAATVHYDSDMGWGVGATVSY